MDKCSDADLVALKEAGALLRFAAERVKDLDPDLSLAIAEARAAAETDQWTPQISQRFWHAFSTLCDLIKPVTMDALETANRTIETKVWTTFGRVVKEMSLPEYSSRRYMSTIIVLMMLILPIQLYVWTCSNLSKRIEEMTSGDVGSLSRSGENFAKLTRDYNSLKASLEERPKTEAPPGDSVPSLPRVRELSPQEVPIADKLFADASKLSSNLDKILYETHLLDNVSSLYFFSYSEPILEEDKDSWDTAYDYASARLFRAETTVYKVLQRANLILGILGSYILPILFGVVGATAYVIRAISEQIKDTTFSQNTPIRHLMRVVLGALAGIVVGLFTGLTGQLSLPPLAIAFLAGYGVEALFSMFDDIIQRFRQAKA